MSLFQIKGPPRRILTCSTFSAPTPLPTFVLRIIASNAVPRTAEAPISYDGVYPTFSQPRLFDPSRPPNLYPKSIIQKNEARVYLQITASPLLLLILVIDHIVEPSRLLAAFLRLLQDAYSLYESGI